MLCKILRPTAFSAGRLTLSPQQAAPRAHLLRSLGGGVFEPTAAVEFKAGEVIGFDGRVTRALAERLQPIEVAVPAVPTETTETTAPRARGRRGR